MISEAPNRRLALLAEGLRTAAGLARVKAKHGFSLEDSDEERMIIGQAFDTFANELEAVAMHLDELLAGLVDDLS